MGFLTTVFANKKVEIPLWNYKLSDDEFSQLLEELNQVRSYAIDPRDATLYYAEWWKRNYNGGSPSKQDIFESLKREDGHLFSAEDFYKNARIGAQMLGVKWIQKQNTLYFRTLLLQGGLPIKHISANKSHYKDFLLELLELQPDTVEDIILNIELTKRLPISSRNETIYENCLAIVKSILNGGDTYASLLNDNNVLREIQSALQVKKNQLNNSVRSVRPKIFWVMNLKKEVANIYLRLGFSSQYSATSLAEILNLSGPAEEKNYHLYLDEKLVCTFRRNLVGSYKTYWEYQKTHFWDTAKLSPQFSCICEDKRWEIEDLIPVNPTIYDPTLWTTYGENEWRLVKGNSINTVKALLLVPSGWDHTNQQEPIEIGGHSLNKVLFEGQISISKEEEQLSFFSKVESFEWGFRTDKPTWIRKADLPIITRRFNTYVYNNDGNIIAPKDYKVFFRQNVVNSFWQPIDHNNTFPIGLIEIKIEYKGLSAYDKLYNIADLKLEIKNQHLGSATLAWSNLQLFNITLAESTKFSTTSINNEFTINLNTEQLSIPDSIPIKLKLGTQKALNFDIITPFSGIGLIDNEGNLLKEGTILTLNDLNGIRILTTNTGDTIIKFWNKLREQVKILKEIHFTHKPLISFKEELQRLFYLADAMRYDNLVTIELFNGKLKQSYFVKGFSHTINDVTTQLERKITTSSTDNQLQLLAVTLNCNGPSIQLFRLQTDIDNYYHLPQDVPNGQFIIISETSNGKQLQPRFINTDPTYEDKRRPSERINCYHRLLLESDFLSSAWEELKAYYNICLEQKIPFSTFDQIRAISRSSMLAAKAFFYLGINQDIDEFIQQQLPRLEQDLGFCFHWINRTDWENAIVEIEKLIGEGYFSDLSTLMAKYFQEIHLDTLYKSICGQRIDAIRINNQFIKDARGQLGVRVLNELPQRTPHTVNEYGIPVNENHMIKLLLRAPIAVAESISGVANKSIWEDSDPVSDLRRNIQYAHFIATDLYTKVLYHCLS